MEGEREREGKRFDVVSYRASVDLMSFHRELRCKPMTATRYASITLSGRVVTCGNP